MNKSLFILNTGSSSLKFKLFGWSKDLPLMASGKVTGIGTEPVFEGVHHDTGQREKTPLAKDATHIHAIDATVDWIRREFPDYRATAAAHRIVHGGDRMTKTALLDTKTMAYLRSLIPLAPLHQGHNLAGADILAEKVKGLKQFGCFDTAFHTTHEKLNDAFALPEYVREKGVRRYGFHGLSYDWVSRNLAEELPHLFKGRVVVAHLGNGSSLCALKNGKSVDTTMGMTALDGLPMGTRCGNIDAGAIIFMMRDMGLTVDKLEKLLYNESGLKGLSGLTNDVKTLYESKDPNAKFALDYYAFKTAQAVAQMAVSIGGLDALIFTGGIGENAGPIRQKILDYLAFLPPFETHMIAADEERGMAQDIMDNFGKELGL